MEKTRTLNVPKKAEKPEKGETVKHERMEKAKAKKPYRMSSDGVLKS